MQTGYTESEQKARDRWELMQRRAMQATRQIITARRIATSQHKIDRLLFALAQKKTQEGIR
jgi:hypothetical protein